MNIARFFGGRGGVNGWENGDGGMIFAGLKVTEVNDDKVSHDGVYEVLTSRATD